MSDSISTHLSTLRVKTPGLHVLSDHHDEFTKYAERWSDVDREVPGSILLPTSEEQIQQAVSRKIGGVGDFVRMSL